MSSSTNLLQEFFAFAAKPHNDSEKISPQKNFVPFWSVMFLSGMACAMITMIAVIFLLDGNSHKLGGFINNLPAWKVLVYAVLIGPLIEELAFRLPLKINKASLAYGIAFLGIFCFRIFFQALYDLPTWAFDYADWRGILFHATVATILALPLLALFQIPGVFNTVQSVLKANYSIWFYTILIAFGAIHILNFEGIADAWFVAPLFILPQLSISFFLGFIRIKMGFRWSYLAHLLNNGAVIGLILLMKSVSPVIVEVMSSFDFALLQNLPISDLLLFGLLNLVFLGFIMLVCYYAFSVIIQYLQQKSYAPDKQLKIARYLNMVFPGLGQDYLQQNAEAKKYYLYLAVATLLTVVPLIIPFTYASINNALLMFAVPVLAYTALTYLSVADIKKLEQRMSYENPTLSKVAIKE